MMSAYAIPITNIKKTRVFAVMIKQLKDKIVTSKTSASFKHKAMFKIEWK